MIYKKTRKWTGAISKYSSSKIMAIIECVIFMVIGFTNAFNRLLYCTGLKFLPCDDADFKFAIFRVVAVDNVVEAEPSPRTDSVAINYNNRCDRSAHHKNQLRRGQKQKI